MRRLRWLIIPVVLLPLAWVLTIGLGRDPAEIPSPLVGKPLPAFSLTSLEGEPVDSADLVGSPMLVNFWASWCIPFCVDEHPVLMDAAATYGDRLVIVGILYDDQPAAAGAFLARYGDGGWLQLDDPTGATALDYGVTGPPESFFVGADGIVMAKHYGPLTTDQLAAYLADLGLTP
jgi:cytochrome c biogenesis protein CcmG/thiol:disulfide interchange protein DsbE